MGSHRKASHCDKIEQPEKSTIVKSCSFHAQKKVETMPDMTFSIYFYGDETMQFAYFRIYVQQSLPPQTEQAPERTAPLLAALS